MSAGTAYSKRYGAGFVDLPTKTTPIDQQFLNAVETALLQLIGAAPTADGQVAQWDNANTRFGPALLLNKNIDPAAAIAKSKLDFTGANGLVDADVSGTAAIARSKLNFGSGLVNADIATAAAIVLSKLAGYPSDATKFARGDGTWAVAPFARNYTEVTKSAVLSVNNTVVTKVPFDIENVDDQNQHDNAVNNTRITFATTGLYLVGAWTEWAVNGTGGRQSIILLNNATTLSQSDVPAQNAATSAGDNIHVLPHVFTAGDFVELQVYHNCGVALNLSTLTKFWAVRLA